MWMDGWMLIWVDGKWQMANIPENKEKVESHLDEVHREVLPRVAARSARHKGTFTPEIFIQVYRANIAQQHL